MINTIKNIILAAVDYTGQFIFNLTGAEVSTGILMIALMGLGISILLILMALILMLIGSLSKGKAPKSKNQQKASAKTSAGPETQTAVAKESAPQTQKPKAKKGLFSIFKRAPKAKVAPNSGGFVFLKNKKAKTAPAVADSLDPLAAIEKEMIALKELYQTGLITADVYVAESRTLYEKAQKIT